MSIKLTFGVLLFSFFTSLSHASDVSKIVISGEAAKLLFIATYKYNLKRLDFGDVITCPASESNVCNLKVDYVAEVTGDVIEISGAAADLLDINFKNGKLDNSVIACGDADSGEDKTYCYLRAQLVSAE